MVEKRRDRRREEAAEHAACKEAGSAFGSKQGQTEASSQEVSCPRLGRLDGRPGQDRRRDAAVLNRKQTD